MVTFQVNGNVVHFNPEAEQDCRLLEYIRDVLKLKGTKCGCDEKICGACTVLVDGEAKRSCALKVSQMDGKTVTTVEGLSQGGNLDPVQSAFVEYNAVQCGFCTPGLIMNVHGLLRKNPNPSEEEIKNFLKINLCRCGTYPRVIAAVKKAAAVLRGDQAPDYQPLDLSRPGSMIGKSYPRLDVADKVTGKTVFYADLEFENSLYGKAVYTPYPYAEILSIDTAPAYEVPGVQLVITAKDIPGSNRHGVLGSKDQPVLCDKYVKYIGDAVAVVFAGTQAAAEAGAGAVKVEYKELQGLFTIEDALAEGAPQIPETNRESFWMCYAAGEKGNISKEVSLKRGDVEQGFAQADVIVEADFSTKPEEHAWIEVDGAIAAYDETGKLAVYSPNQSPFSDRGLLAPILNMKPEDIRIVHMPCGGAFGGKTELTTHAYVAIATLKTGRPARMVLSRKDSIRTHPKRHPYNMHYKAGATKDGKLTAMQVRIVADSGPYVSWTPRVLEQGISYCTGPYFVPNMDLSAMGVYTNNPLFGAMRGFGAGQSHFASESIMSMLADKLGMDQIAIREINGLEKGLRMTTGQLLTDRIGIDYKETLKEARKSMEKKFLPLKASGKHIGIGVASGWRSVAGGLGPDENAGATFELLPDGKVSFRIACTEMGQGSHTSLCQIASEATGIAVEDFVVTAGDTDHVLYGGGVMASRGVFLWGHAALSIANDFHTLLVRAASKQLNMSEDVVDLRNSVFVVKSHGKADGAPLMTLAELAAASDEKLMLEKDTMLPKTVPVLPNTNEDDRVDPMVYKPHHTVAYNTTLAAVQVDEATGKVKVLDITEICDGGTIINPDAAATQIEGGIIMGAAYGMTNNFQFKDGKPVTDNLGKCKVPRFPDIPQSMEVIFAEADDPTGPFGSKGVAEIGVLTPAPAICNAIYDAVGFRVYNLPVVDHAAEIKAFLAAKE
ncbi:MAG: molybdopterin-dependent oxidoreductase [Oscillibacter sp.]|nr:molybdopterin-dependent oxidoreductase [Oscillibacter sp.]